MAVTATTVAATTVAAATTILAAVAAVFLTFVLCFCIFLCAKRYRGGDPAAGVGGVAEWLRSTFGGGGGRGGGPDGAVAWCYEGGLDDKSMAKLPRREVGKGEALDCAVCITELAAGETARVLPRCGHGFHAHCVDEWLRSHSTCPLCRCPAVDEPPAVRPVPTPEADPESPNFPTNVLFFGSQDDVTTGSAQQRSPASPLSPSREQAAGVAVEAPRALGLRRLLGCGGASPPPQQPPHHNHHHYQDADGDIEMGLAAGSGESSASRPVKPPQPGS